MKTSADDARAMMARVHSLAVAAMEAATADVSPSPEIPDALWKSIPLPVRVALRRTHDEIDKHDSAVAAAARSRPARLAADCTPPAAPATLDRRPPSRPLPPAARYRSEPAPRV